MIKLDLKVEEVQVILNALSALPYGQVSKLVEAIVSQAETQLKEKEETKKGGK